MPDAMQVKPLSVKLVKFGEITLLLLILIYPF